MADAVRSHLTPALKGAIFAKLPPAEALKCYLTFAQEQLAATAATEVAGSMALLGMGKLYAALAAQNGTAVRGAESKAVVCYQASLLVCPQNYLSSNDLGVILGRGGHYTEARIALEHSVSICRQAASWHNLAVVYRQLGCATHRPRRAAQCCGRKGRNHGQPGPTRGGLARFALVRRVVRKDSRRGRAAAAAEHAGNGPRRRRGEPPPARPLPAARVKPGSHVAGVLPMRFSANPTQPSSDMGGMPSRREASGRHVFLGNEHAYPRLRRVKACHPTGRRAMAVAVTLAVGMIAAAARETLAGEQPIRLCQALSPAARRSSRPDGRLGSLPLHQLGRLCARPIRGPRAARRARAEYRLRVDDQLDLIYRITRDVNTRPYTLEVGDEIRVESFIDADLNRDLVVLPDGTITLRLLGSVPTAGRTVTQCGEPLELLSEVLQGPLDYRHSAESQHEADGLAGDRRPQQGLRRPVAVGANHARRLNRAARHRLRQRRAHPPRAASGDQRTLPRDRRGNGNHPRVVRSGGEFVYVLGEVHAPGRFEMVGPTTVLQAISLAGSWNVGANLRQVVVLRRGDDWRPLGTMVNLQAALLGNDLSPPARSGSPTPTS